MGRGPDNGLYPSLHIMVTVTYLLANGEDAIAGILHVWLVDAEHPDQGLGRGRLGDLPLYEPLLATLLASCLKLALFSSLPPLDLGRDGQLPVCPPTESTVHSKGTFRLAV